MDEPHRPHLVVEDVHEEPDGPWGNYRRVVEDVQDALHTGGAVIDQESCNSESTTPIVVSFGSDSDSSRGGSVFVIDNDEDLLSVCQEKTDLMYFDNFFIVICIVLLVVFLCVDKQALWRSIKRSKSVYIALLGLPGILFYFYKISWITCISIIAIVLTVAFYWYLTYYKTSSSNTDESSQQLQLQLIQLAHDDKLPVVGEAHMQAVVCRMESSSKSDQITSVMAYSVSSENRVLQEKLQKSQETPLEEIFDAGILTQKRELRNEIVAHFDQLEILSRKMCTIDATGKAEQWLVEKARSWSESGARSAEEDVFQVYEKVCVLKKNSNSGFELSSREYSNETLVRQSNSSDSSSCNEIVVADQFIPTILQRVKFLRVQRIHNAIQEKIFTKWQQKVNLKVDVSMGFVDVVDDNIGNCIDEVSDLQRDLLVVKKYFDEVRLLPTHGTSNDPNTTAAFLSLSHFKWTSEEGVYDIGESQVNSILYQGHLEQQFLKLSQQGVVLQRADEAWKGYKDIAEQVDKQLRKTEDRALAVVQKQQQELQVIDETVITPFKETAKEIEVKLGKIIKIEKESTVSAFLISEIILLFLCCVLFLALLTQCNGGKLSLLDVFNNTLENMCKVMSSAETKTVSFSFHSFIQETKCSSDIVYDDDLFSLKDGESSSSDTEGAIWGMAKNVWGGISTTSSIVVSTSSSAFSAATSGIGDKFLQLVDLAGMNESWAKVQQVLSNLKELLPHFVIFRFIFKVLQRVWLYIVVGIFDFGLFILGLGSFRIIPIASSIFDKLPHILNNFLKLMIALLLFRDLVTELLSSVELFAILVSLEVACGYVIRNYVLIYRKQRLPRVQFWALSICYACLFLFWTIIAAEFSRSAYRSALAEDICPLRTQLYLRQHMSSWLRAVKGLLSKMVLDLSHTSDYCSQSFHTEYLKNETVQSINE